MIYPGGGVSKLVNHQLHVQLRYNFPFFLGPIILILCLVAEKTCSGT